MNEVMLNETEKLPERKLIVALLRRAIFDLLGNAKVEKYAAEEWIFEESDDSCGTFSFAWACLQIDIDPELMRSRLNTVRNGGLRLFGDDDEPLAADEPVRHRA